MYSLHYSTREEQIGVGAKAWDRREERRHGERWAQLKKVSMILEQRNDTMWKTMESCREVDMKRFKRKKC